MFQNEICVIAGPKCEIWLSCMTIKKLTFTAGFRSQETFHMENKYHINYEKVIVQALNLDQCPPMIHSYLHGQMAGLL